MPSVAVNGVQLYYEEYGAGPPVLGIHGTPSSAILWKDAAQELGQQHRCVIYDRRGFGRSTRPADFETSDLTEHVSDAAALLEALAASPAVVIGRSTGGVVALALAQRHPDHVSALVLLEPALLRVDPVATVWARRVRHNVLAAAAQEPCLAAEMVIREALGDAMWESFPAELQKLFAAASDAVLAEIRGRGLDLSADPLVLPDEELAALRLPVLLLTGEDSPAPLRRVNDRLLERMPHAEAGLVAGGHLIHPAHPAVLDFLDRLPA